MAETLCNLKKSGSSGGGDTGILLWENTGDTYVDPTSSTDFTDYSKLRIVFSLNTDRYTSDDDIEMIIPISMITVGSSWTAGDTLGPKNYRGSASHDRIYWINSNNKKKLLNQGTGITNKDWVVRKVYGIA